MVLKKTLVLLVTVFCLVFVPTPELCSQPNLRIVIKKSARKLYLYKSGHLINVFPIALGWNPMGTKLEKGDGKTPEGDYYVISKNPNSRFYLSLQLSYPNHDDACRGLTQHFINESQKKQIVEAVCNDRLPPQNTRLGGDIFIHGGGISEDWTAGCVALSNPDIETLFKLIPVGTDVIIEP
ncbi:MAG: L,D-transpeptidase [Parcubacteria group bacterium]|nr:L,D-transpeptidase [Parcubacteria group bacterium]